MQRRLQTKYSDDLLECMASGDNVEETNGANFMSCAQKTAIGQISLTGPGATPWAVASIVDSQVDVDEAAERGQRGILPAWENCAGDLLAGASFGIEGRVHYLSKPPKRLDRSVTGFMKHSWSEFVDLF